MKNSLYKLKLQQKPKTPKLLKLKTRKLKHQNFKIDLYDFQSFIFLKVLILEGYYFTGYNSSMYDIRQSKIYHFKAIHKSIMAGQKKKKKLVSRKSFAFLNAYCPKTHQIQSVISLDSSRPYGRLLENQKTGL